MRHTARSEIPPVAGGPLANPKSSGEASQLLAPEPLAPAAAAPWSPPAALSLGLKPSFVVGDNMRGASAAGPGVEGGA